MKISNLKPTNHSYCQLQLLDTVIMDGIAYEVFNCIQHDERFKRMIPPQSGAKEGTL